VIEYATDTARIPLKLIDQHVDAVRATYREYARSDAKELAGEVDRVPARSHGRVSPARKSRACRSSRPA